MKTQPYGCGIWLIYVTCQELLTEVNKEFYNIKKHTLILGGRIEKNNTIDV